MVFGIAGAILQILPIGLVLLWHFLRGTERPHDLCNPFGMGTPRITEVQILSGFWEKVLRLILLYSPPDEPASGCLAASRTAIIEQIPLLECMTPRIVTGFLAVFTVSIYHLVLRAARTAYPPLRVAHAALLEPARGLSVVWGLRSGMIAYELLRYFFSRYFCKDVWR